MANNRKIRSKSGEEIEVPDDFDYSDLVKPAAVPKPVKKDSENFAAFPMANFGLKASGADKVLDYFGGHNQGGELAVDSGQILGGLAVQSLPINPIVKAFLEPVGSFIGGRFFGKGAELKGSGDVPDTESQLFQSVLGSAVGQAIKGGTVAAQELAAFVKAAKSGNVIGNPSAITKWLSERYLPTRTVKGEKIGIHRKFEPPLPYATDDMGNVLEESPYLRGEDVLKFLQKEKYPILTSQATRSSNAARQEAGSNELGNIFNAQDLVMRNIAGEISESGLRRTPQSRALDWEQEVLNALPGADSKTAKEFKASRLGKTLGRPTGTGKKEQRLKSAEEGLREAFKINNSADFDRLSRVIGKGRTSELLKEEFVSSAFDGTSGQFSTDAARKFLKNHQSKLLKTLDSEERHSINRFMAALDYHDARKDILNYVPSMSRGGENATKAALGIAVTNPLRQGISQASGRQLANFAYFGLDKMILNKLITQPKFAYAAARLTELPAGSKAAKGPLKTILGMVGKAGVTIKLDVGGGNEIEMMPSEDGNFITPLGAKQPAKTDDLFR